MAKRSVVWVQYDADRSEWQVIRGQASWFSRNVYDRKKTKAEAVDVAIDVCRELAAKGRLVQLKVRNLNGQIGFESTYGEDPERHPS